MSDLLNSASLVMIPSGYKEDTVYSVVPSDGSGDLSFTRASNGTRVNSAGLVEVCPWNLNTNSENFTSNWGTDGTSTATNNFATAPNGTTTAAKVVANAANGYAYKFLPVPAGVYTLSFYVRASASGTMSIGINDVGGSGSSPKYNIPVTTEWQRIEHFANITLGTTVYIDYGSLQTGKDYFLWGAQLNIGSTAKPYFPTTDRLNVPRLTYQNGGGGCPSLLLEKQSTNVLTYSEDFSNAVYTKRNSTIGSNVATSPDGTTNADKIQEDTSNDRHDIYADFSCTNGVTYTQTIFAKQGERRYCFMSFGSSTINTGNSYFDLQDGVVVSSPSGVTSAIQNMGNGWFRCSITATASASGIAYLVNGPAITGSNFIYQGVSGYGIYIWGVQIEASSYPTSYIPTTSSSATRVVDRCYKTSASSLIGQTSGVFFGDLVFDSSESVNRMFSITGTDWNTDGSIRFDIINNQPEIYARKGGADIGSGTSSYTINKGQRIKFAVVYTASNMKLFVDGAQRGTTTTLSTTPPTCSQVYVNELGGGFSSTSQNNQGSKWNEVVLFPTALTDAEAIALTTL